MAPREKLTKTVQQRFIHAIDQGSTIKAACQYAGIGQKTFYEWKERGRAGVSKKYTAFLKAYERAESEAAMRSLACLNLAASDGTWQAAAWLLERRHGYRKEQVFIEEVHHVDPEYVDPATPEGRAAISAQLAQLPKDLLEAVLKGM